MTPAPTSDRPDAPFRVLGMSGSLRRGSSNTALVRLLARELRQLAGDEIVFEELDWIDQLPFYNDDLEADPPAVVSRLREEVRGADALVIGLPEYNSMPPALLKNVIDWLSRPFGQAALTGKVIALVTSAGKGAGVRVQEATGMILGFFGNTIVQEPPVRIALGAQRIGADGVTEDREVLEAVAGKAHAVLDALRTQRAG